MDLIDRGMDSVRRFLNGEEDRSVERMPKRRFRDWLPKTRYYADVTKAGQVVVPAEERDQGNWPDIEPGDHYHVHCFPPSLQDERVAANRYVAFDTTVTANHYLTIPKEARDEYDIRHEDTVALHLYSISDAPGAPRLVYPTNTESPNPQLDSGNTAE